MGRISKSLKAIVIDAGVGAHSGITYVAKFDRIIMGITYRWERRFVQ